MAEEILSSSKKQSLLVRYLISGPDNGVFIVGPFEMSKALREASRALDCPGRSCGSADGVQVQIVEGQVSSTLATKTLQFRELSCGFSQAKALLLSGFRSRSTMHRKPPGRVRGNIHCGWSIIFKAGLAYGAAL